MSAESPAREPRQAKQPSTTHNIIKKIEAAKNKEAVIREYKKILGGLDEEFRSWVSDHTEDMLGIAQAIEEIKENNESVAHEYSKIESLLEVLRKNDENFRSKSSLLEKKGGRFNKLMKLNLNELLSDSPELLTESSLGTPANPAVSVLKDSKASLMSKVSEAMSSQIGDQHLANILRVSENIEKLQISILEKDVEKGIAALAALVQTEASDPKSFGSFQTYGRYKELKDSFFASLEDSLVVASVEQFQEKEKNLAVVKLLIDAGFYAEAEDAFFRACSILLDSYRSEKLFQAKEGEELIDSEASITEYFRGFFELLVEVAEMVAKKFFFKTNERTNSAKFGNWIVTQVSISLNEMMANLSDHILLSQKRIHSLKRRLVIEFCNFDTKGLSCSFLLDEFFDKYARLTSYQRMIEENKLAEEGQT